jgi:hypothetical protein
VKDPIKAAVANKARVIEIKYDMKKSYLIAFDSPNQRCGKLGVEPEVLQIG